MQVKIKLCLSCAYVFLSVEQGAWLVAGGIGNGTFLRGALTEELMMRDNKRSSTGTKAAAAPAAGGGGGSIKCFLFTNMRSLSPDSFVTP